MSPTLQGHLLYAGAIFVLMLVIIAVGFFMRRSGDN